MIAVKECDEHGTEHMLHEGRFDRWICMKCDGLVDELQEETE